MARSICSASLGRDPAIALNVTPPGGGVSLPDVARILAGGSIPQPCRRPPCAVLERLTVRGFKSLRDVTFRPAARLSVLFGPNAAGKSNLLEAAQALSAMAFARTLHDVLGHPLPVRGHSFESFSLPPGGIPALLRDGGPGPVLTLEADLATDSGSYCYRISPKLHPASGHLGIGDEYLVKTRTKGPKPRAAIEAVDGRLHIRRKGRPAHPRQEGLGTNHSVLSDHSLSGVGYEWLDAVRNELESWRIYTPEPRFQMRTEQAPADVFDIGIFGQSISPFLHKLHAHFPKDYEQVSRLLRQCIPGIERMEVLLNEQRGTLDLAVLQTGIWYSSRVISEGTLRTIAFCAIAMNPWAKGGLVAVEEPENGVHPQRLKLIARLLLSLAQNNRQVIVTTHSPLFISTIAAAKRRSDDPDGIGLFQVHVEGGQTVLEPFDIPGALFEDDEIATSLSDRGEQSVVEGLLLRGILDA